MKVWHAAAFRSNLKVKVAACPTSWRQHGANQPSLRWPEWTLFFHRWWHYKYRSGIISVVVVVVGGGSESRLTTSAQCVATSQSASVDTSPSTTVPASTAAAAICSVASWSDHDVQKWLRDNDLDVLADRFCDNIFRHFLRLILLRCSDAVDSRKRTVLFRVLWTMKVYFGDCGAVCLETRLFCCTMILLMLTGQSRMHTTKQIFVTFVIFEPPGVFPWPKNNNDNNKGHNFGGAGGSGLRSDVYATVKH